MAQPAPTLHNELPSEVAQRVQEHLGIPFKEFVMDSTVRYYVRMWLLIFLSITVLSFFPFSSQKKIDVLGTGLYLLLIVGAWLIYFSAPFRRYGKQHATHIYLCPNGLLGVRGGCILYTFEWAQVHSANEVNYGRAGSLYKLKLVDGRKIILKRVHQPIPGGIWHAGELIHEINRALIDYRTQHPGAGRSGRHA